MIDEEILNNLSTLRHTILTTVKDTVADALEDALKAIETKAALCHKDVWTLSELACYTGFKESYIYKLTAMRLIPHFKPNGKSCFFRREEIEDWLTSRRVATNDELDERVAAELHRLDAAR